MFQIPIVKRTTYHRWTEQEIQQLIYIVQINGKKWKQIQQAYFPDITSDAVRSKYNEFSKNSQPKNYSRPKEADTPIGNSKTKQDNVSQSSQEDEQQDRFSFEFSLQQSPQVRDEMNSNMDFDIYNPFMSFTSIFE